MCFKSHFDALTHALYGSESCIYHLRRIQGRAIRHTGGGDESACGRSSPEMEWKAPISALQHPHSKADVWKLVRAAYPSPRYGSPTCWFDLRAGVVWIRLWHDAREPHHPAAAVRRCGQHIRIPYDRHTPWRHLRQPLAAISSIGNHACSDAAVYGRRKESSVIHYTPQHLHQRSMQAQHAGGAFMQS